MILFLYSQFVVPPPGDIIDSWYYDNFESTRKQIMFGLECFFSHLIDTGELS